LRVFRPTGVDPIPLPLGGGVDVELWGLGAALEAAEADQPRWPVAQSLYVKGRRLKYVFNWVCTNLQTVEADRDISAGRHVLAVAFEVQGPSREPKQPGFTGTATLYIDDQPVGSGKIVTQPGYFCGIGDGIRVGRDSASPVAPDYADRGTFTFVGGTIEEVVVDVSGERYGDHEAQVRVLALDRLAAVGTFAPGDGPGRPPTLGHVEQHLEVIDKTVAKTYEWIHQVGDCAGFDDAHRAYQVLRATLHALRDRVEPNVAAHVAAQLPLLLRGVYYEGWDPARTPMKMSLSEFLARVEDEAGLKGTSAAEDAVRAVMTVCWDELGEGTMGHLVSVLPSDFATLM